MRYRSLTSKEIRELEKQGCCCGEWNRVSVAESFTPTSCKNVTFSGDIQLGSFDHSFTMGCGIVKKSGLYSATIHNCTIDNDVYISSIQNYIANYHIEEKVFIENVNTLSVEEKTSFGNGTWVSVLNEFGGRKIPIFDGLSAQLAYCMVFYRHKSKLLTRLEELINEHIAKVSSTRGVVGEESKIVNSDILKNIRVGKYCSITGAERLDNGSINSCREAPVEIGFGVIADNFIINCGSQLLDRSIIYNCFIGEGCEMSKQYSAEESLFFSNFIGHHGEAYAIFTGPHTATHHKSTLLISAYFSFMNAGSGSNQSNHMYKLGPLHQGIMDRGSKTASNSYLLWPARVGAFTVVLGRHTKNSDTTNLPYSYLIEDDGKSILIPGVNLKSVGTIRDADKWPLRDRRTGKRLDIINYDLLTPYTVGHMKRGLDILKELQDDEYNHQDVRFGGVHIPMAALEKGLHYYEMGIIKYIGNILVKQLQDNSFDTLEELRCVLTNSSDIGIGDWVDMAGFVAPRKKIELALTAVEEGSLETLEELHSSFCEINSHFYEWSWNWCSKQIEEYLGKPLSDISVADLLQFLKRWITVTEQLDDYFIDDAKKEFSKQARTGFGIDGTRVTQIADFAMVRGNFENNSFIKRIHLHCEKKQNEFREIQAKLKAFMRE